MLTTSFHACYSSRSIAVVVIQLQKTGSLLLCEEWERDSLAGPKGRHWYRTHELAWYILKRFNTHLKIEEARRFFAHANSAKCCVNNEGRKKAPRRLFRNCKRYLSGELKVLDPDILVTQGDEAKNAVQSMNNGIVKRIDKFASIVTLNRKQIFWLHTYHPGNYGKFNPQRNFDNTIKVAVGWEYYVSKIHDFIVGKSA